jgi:hypothetical protein
MITVHEEPAYGCYEEDHGEDTREPGGIRLYDGFGR